MNPTPTFGVFAGMIGGLIVAALVIGTIDGRLVPATRIKGSLIFYALPVLPVMGFGLVVAQSLWRFDAGPANHCRNDLCRSAVFRQADLSLLLHQGVVELACFAVMVAILGARSVRLGSRIGAMARMMPGPPLLPGFDSAGVHDYNPDNFHIDPDTGQSYRIMRRRFDGTLVLDKKTYQERQQDYWNAANSSYDFFKGLLFVCAAGVAVAVAWVMMPGPFVAFVVIMAALVIGIPARLLFLSVAHAIATPVLQARVGPPPVAPRGRENVQAQKAHGKGGWLNPQETRDALRSDPVASSSGGAEAGLDRAQQTYRD